MCRERNTLAVYTLKKKKKEKITQCDILQQDSGGQYSIYIYNYCPSNKCYYPASVLLVLAYNYIIIQYCI